MDPWNLGDAYWKAHHFQVPCGNLPGCFNDIQQPPPHPGCDSFTSDLPSSWTWRSHGAKSKFGVDTLYHGNFLSGKCWLDHRSVCSKEEFFGCLEDFLFLGKKVDVVAFFGLIFCCWISCGMLGYFSVGRWMLFWCQF